jgi:hypothetical protein
MGPGLAVKAIGGRHVSLMVFGFSQVLIDLEPLVRMIRGDAILHGWTHTFAGATGIGIVAVLVGRPVCQFLLDRWTPVPGSGFLAWLRGPRRIGWPAAFAGAFIGTYSHILLDSVMHRDMAPFAPVSAENALLHAITVEALHLACIASAFAGAAIFGVVFLLQRRGASR